MKLTESRVKKVVEILEKERKKSAIVDSWSATQIMYHIFARERGWSREAVNRMTDEEIQIELALLEEDKEQERKALEAAKSGGQG